MLMQGHTHTLGGNNWTLDPYYQTNITDWPISFPLSHNTQLLMWRRCSCSQLLPYATVSRCILRNKKVANKSWSLVTSLYEH